MDKTYSFIIPHHNTPDLLQRLVDSIPQREDVEIIIVDDNSDEDKKANVIRPDVKTIFIDKEHTKGAGHARNVGMDAATGKWLLFADADDFYKPGFIDVLDEYKDDDIELLFFNIDSVDSDTLLPITSRSKLPRKLIEQYNGSEESAEKLLYLCYTPWRKMHKREFIRKYGFRFEEIPRGNDVLFTYLTSYFVKKWKVDRRIIYTVTYSKKSMSYNSQKFRAYKNALVSMRRRAKFFEFIGHSEWNVRSVRGKRTQSVLHYILIILKHEPITGLKAIVYYITHFLSVEKKSNYYIEEISMIENQISTY